MRSDAAEYELLAPASLAEALNVIASEPGQWMPIAGGTELMVQLGAGRLRARKLVSIWNLAELRGIEATAVSLRIGAGCTFTDLRTHAVVAEQFPLLSQAAGWTGGIANQNRGTLGGNIVNGSPAADSPPALLVYDAELELASARGARIVPYAGFHTGYKTTVLAPDELVSAIVLPLRFALYYQYLRKVGPRSAQAISKVALAGIGIMENGLIADLKIAVASMAHAPLRCSATEQMLLGRSLKGSQIESVIASGSAALAAECAPLDDIRSTAKYRSHVAGNLLAEFLRGLQAAGNDEGNQE